MSMTPVGLTSRWIAANRAREAEAPEPLFDDPYAAALAGEEGFALLAAGQKAKPWPTADGPDPYLSIRTRFFDDALMRVANEANLRQVVLLAAGMDARAFRLPWPEGTTLFEVDRDDVLDHKEAVLHALSARPKCPRQVVLADLGGDWVGALLQAGFDAERPAAFLAEGLLAYLEPEAVTSLLGALRGFARPGSWLGLDVIGSGLISSPYSKPFLELFQRLGCPWRFSTDEPEQLLARYGWSARAVLPGQPEAHYGRWPFPVAPRDVPGFPRSYLVTAWRQA
jgi:methyltransferase (TIGR00027 family)